MITVTPRQMESLTSNVRDEIAARLYSIAPGVASLTRFRAYIEEVIAHGITRQRDVTEACMALALADRTGRSALVQSLLSDPDVGGELKSMQIVNACGQST